MITTRTRVLSILATVAMLVSMFACFVIPASAAATKKGAKAVWDELTWNDSAAKTEVQTLYGNSEFDEMISKMAAALSSGAAVWKAFDPTPGANPYPVFQYHEEFETVGYDCLNWSISTVADWTAMNTVASQAPDAETGEVNRYVDTTTGKYFDGITFHLTGDINFDQSSTSWMWPMGSYKDGDNSRAFCGTLNGHGYEFQDVYIYSVNSTKEDYITGYDCNNNGLFNSIGDAEIIDFGIGTGTIRMSSGDGTSSASLFGAVVPNTKDTAPTFTRVWSGATIYGASNGHVSALVGANGGVGAVGDMRAVEVNGFSFFGKLKKSVADGKSGHTRNMVYGVYGANTASSADGGTFSNIITYPTLDLVKAIISSAEQTSDAIFGFSGDLTGDIASVNNVYGIGFTKAYRNTIAADLNKAAGRSFKDDATLQWTGTAVEAAYDSNNKQGATNPIYFELVGDEIRPTGTVDEHVIKYDITINNEGDVTTDTGYMNSGNALDLITKFELEGATVDVKVGGETVAPTDGVYDINDDVTITASISAIGAALSALNDLLEPYEGLDADHFKTTAEIAIDGKIGLADFLEQANAAIAANNVDLLEAAVAAHANVVAEITDIYPNFPKFEEHAKYSAFNADNNWMILDPADWAAMDVLADDSAAYPTKSLLFDGYTFHLYGDVDFENEEMTPLGWENTKFPYFNATINGHGYGFSRINIKGAAGATSLGLIKSMGNCTFIDFGINSGTITATDASAAGGISNFGMVYPVADVTATFTRVWSGATLKAECDTHVSTLAGTYNYRSIQVDVNGFTFYGKVDYASAGVYTMAYGVVGGHSSAPGDHGTFANIITYPELNVPKAEISDVEYPSTAIFGFSSEAAYTAAKVENISNVYGIGFEKAYRAAGGTDLGGSNNAVANAINKAEGRVFVETTELQYAGTPGAAAHELNAKNLGFYFTLAADGGIRPTGTEANRIVKYAITLNGEDQDPIYANAGAAVDITKVVTDDISEAEVVVSDANGTLTPDADGKYAITGDVTIALTMAADDIAINELKAALADKIAEVEAFIADKVNLDMNYFKTGAISAEDWLALAKSDVLADLEAAKAHLDNGDLVIELREDYPNFPAYKDHAKYEAYQPANANWLIVDKADWTAMDATITEPAANNNYFANTTFHLVGDVDFNGSESESIYPLGAWNGNYFSGTINGHGYGFEDVNIRVKEADLKEPTEAHPEYTAWKYNKFDAYAGLIAFLGECSFVDFGVNSGTIHIESAAGGGNVSTFGLVTVSNGVTFTRVWSGAKLSGASNAHISALAGVPNNTTNAIVVDGFVFSGKMEKNANARTMAYGIYGGNKGAADGSTFSNIITYPSSMDINKDSVPTSEADGEKYASAIFGFSSADAYAAATISNVYGIGFEKAYRATVADSNSAAGRVFGDDANILITDRSAKDLARELNAIGAETGVYYKLDANGKLRPTSEANTLVKATINFVDQSTGKTENTRTEYFNNSGTFGLRDAYSLKFMFGDEDVVVEGDGSYVGGVLTVNGDVTVTVNYTECDHKDAEGNYLYQYTHIDETKKHTRFCPVCEYTDEKNCSIDWVAGEVNAEDGTSYHTGACTLCTSPEYTEVCNGVDTANPDDCTADHTWNFECKVHEATYPAGKGNDEHTFTGAWTDVEGTNKQTDKCANCTTVQSRINENVAITNSEFTLATKGNGEIVVKLPEGIKSAKLEIAVEGDYNFEIEGMTPVDGYYVIGTGITSVTVKVTADVTATGGKLTATLSEVAAIDEYVEIAGDKVAEIAIGFEGTMYDADGNGTINLADALAALYVKAGKTDAPAINLANVDTNTNGAVDIDEVYAIVQKWLSDVIGTL